MIITALKSNYAELRNWYYVGNMIHGEIYGDPRGKYRDGTGLYTGYITDKRDHHSYIVVDTLGGRTYFMFQHHKHKTR